jgi:hypothetical protein
VAMKAKRSKGQVSKQAKLRTSTFCPQLIASGVFSFNRIPTRKKIAASLLTTALMVGYSMFSRALPVAVLCAALSSAAAAETVTVKYRGPVPLDTFQCATIDRSSLVKRVCYDAAQEYMVILLRGTYYHYCEIGQGVVNALLAADSMGRYFNANIKGSGSDGPFDCRTHRVPDF